MKLTQQNIENLYKFTRQHYVYHYDVQTELVDHLANDIENIWQENPTLSFEKARDKSFKKFGIFGFMDVIEEKQKQMNKRYLKIFWKFFKEWFTIPKIIITITIFFVFYTLMTLKIKEYYFLSFFLLLAIVDVFLAQKLVKKTKKRFKEKNKKWLMEDIIFRTGSFNGIFICSNFFQFAPLADNVEALTAKIIYSSIFTIAVLFSYVTLVVIPQKAEELLEETYPEYKLVNSL